MITQSKRNIVITYKDGTVINIDVPDLYYKNKYKKYPDKKLHKVFIKEYDAFVNAMSKQDGMINVGKYLKFSNASVNSHNVLGIDLKEVSVDAADSSVIRVPGVHDQVYLNIDDTKLETLINKICDSGVLDSADALFKKLNAFMNKSNVEFTIKKTAKDSQKKSSSNTVVDSTVPTNSDVGVDSATNSVANNNDVELDKPTKKKKGTRKLLLEDTSIVAEESRKEETK